MFGEMPVYTDRFLTETEARKLRPTKSRTHSKMVKRLRRKFPVVYFEKPKMVAYRVGNALVMHPDLLEQIKEQVPVEPRIGADDVVRMTVTAPLLDSGVNRNMDVYELAAGKMTEYVKGYFKAHFPVAVPPRFDFPASLLEDHYSLARPPGGFTYASCF